MPLSATYMTDIPCLFYTLTSLYSIARSAEESRPPQALAWLALGAVVGFVGGTGRQVVWLVPIVVLPYLAWVKRREPRFASAVLVAWMLIGAGTVRVSEWFNHQYFVAEQPSVLNEIKMVLRQPFATVALAARLLLMLLLVTLPAAIPLVLRLLRDTWRGTLARRILVSVLLVAVFGLIFVHPSLASIPWISSTFNWEGINGSSLMPGRPIVLIRPVRAAVAVTVYVAVCLLLGELVAMPGYLRRIATFFRGDGKFALAAMVLFNIVYFALLLIRGIEVDLFDRYLLPIMPGVAVAFLLWSGVDPESLTAGRRTWRLSWAALAVLAVYAVVSTQDYWSLSRAVVVATRRLEVAGVARASIDAGLDYNGWTELLLTGQINDRWVKNPPGAYRPEFGITPEVVPVYRLEYKPQPPETAASEYGSVPYFSLLPPFRKQVSIDRVSQKTYKH